MDKNGKREAFGSEVAMMPLWLEAGFWGMLAGSSLVLGAVLAYAIRIPQRVVAGIMAFGSGVMISTVCFELMEDAFRNGGLLPTLLGFAIGAIIYSAANRVINTRGAKHRKRSGNQQPSEDEVEGSGLAIAVGALLDGIPESMAIGLTILTGGSVSLVTVAAIFISNIPEGLSSAAGMKHARRSARFIFGVWVGIAAASGMAALLGYAVFLDFSAGARSVTIAIAAGGIMAMLVDTMIPEAFEGTHDLSGLIASAGFLTAFALSMLGG